MSTPWMEIPDFRRFPLIKSHEICPWFFVVIYPWYPEFQLYSDSISFVSAKVNAVLKWEIPSSYDWYLALLSLYRTVEAQLPHLLTSYNSRSVITKVSSRYVLVRTPNSWSFMSHKRCNFIKKKKKNEWICKYHIAFLDLLDAIVGELHRSILHHRSTHNYTHTFGCMYNLYLSIHVCTEIISTPGEASKETHFLYMFDYFVEYFAVVASKSRPTRRAQLSNFFNFLAHFSIL